MKLFNEQKQKIRSKNMKYDIEEFNSLYDNYQKYIDVIKQNVYWDDDKTVSFGVFINIYTEKSLDEYIEYIKECEFYGRIATDEYLPYDEFIQNQN